MQCRLEFSWDAVCSPRRRCRGPDFHRRKASNGRCSESGVVLHRFMPMSCSRPRMPKMVSSTPSMYNGLGLFLSISRESGETVGYHVSEACASCLYCTNNGHRWMFYSKSVSSRERVNPKTGTVFFLTHNVHKATDKQNKLSYKQA